MASKLIVFAAEEAGYLAHHESSHEFDSEEILPSFYRHVAMHKYLDLLIFSAWNLLFRSQQERSLSKDLKFFSFLYFNTSRSWNVFYVHELIQHETNIR